MKTDCSRLPCDPKNGKEIHEVTAFHSIPIKHLEEKNIINYRRRCRSMVSERKTTKEIPKKENLLLKNLK